MATRTVNTLDRTIVTRFPDIVLLGCVLGFVFLLIELYLYQHYNKGTQIVGFVSTALGILLAALGFVRARAVRGVVMVLLGVMVLVGVFGVIEHRETRQEDAAKFAQRQAQQTSTGTTTQSQGTQSTPAQGGDPGEGGPGGNGPRVFRSNIPVLSPLALSALSALTLLSMVARGGEVRNRLN